jgi:Protein of unknown function (DUF3606)
VSNVEDEINLNVGPDRSARPTPQPAPPRRAQGLTMADLTKQAVPDRSKIALDRPDQVKYWTRHLGITDDELRRAIERVGNSAAAVRKELGLAEHP